ncbi:MAG: DNA polymerase III subunit delta', partial [Corynebacterium variabile]
MTTPAVPDASDVFSRAALSPHVIRPLRDAVLSARQRVTDGDPFGVVEDAVNDAAMTHSWLFTGPPGSG